MSPCVFVTLLEIVVANHRPVPPRGEVCSECRVTIALHKLQGELPRNSRFLHPCPFYNSIWSDFSLMICEIRHGLVQVSKFCYFQSRFQSRFNYHFSLHFAWLDTTLRISHIHIEPCLWSMAAWHVTLVGTFVHARRDLVEHYPLIYVPFHIYHSPSFALG